MDTLFQAGANRGGKEFARFYSPHFPQPSRVIVADPKRERAVLLAAKWQQKLGIDAVGHREFCEDLVMEIPGNSVGMLSVDTVRPMVEVMEKRPDLPVQWQIVGRGAGSQAPVLGFSGSIVRGDKQALISSALLLDNLSPYASTVSSRHIITDSLNAMATSYTRRVLSQHSARRISLLDRQPKDIPDGSLNLFFGQEQFPLVVERGTVEPFKDTKKRALEIENPFIDHDRAFAAAIVLTNRVELFIIEKRRRNRRVRFHTTFGDAPSLAPSLRPQQDTGAVVTD